MKTNLQVARYALSLSQNTDNFRLNGTVYARKPLAQVAGGINFTPKTANNQPRITSRVVEFAAAALNDGKTLTAPERSSLRIIKGLVDSYGDAGTKAQLRDLNRSAAATRGAVTKAS